METLPEQRRISAVTLHVALNVIRRTQPKQSRCDNFINSVICYGRLYIMKCKIQDKQIAIERFLNLAENEGVLYPI